MSILKFCKSFLKLEGHFTNWTMSLFTYYREGYYLQRKEPREATVEHAEWQAKMNEVAHLAEIIIGKQRHGPIGKVTLEFEERFTKFKDTQNN